MTFFKFTGINSSSKKNKTSSAANTPSQTPRTSVHLNASDLAAVNKTNNKGMLSHDEALEMLFKQGTAIGHLQAMSMSRV